MLLIEHFAADSHRRRRSQQPLPCGPGAQYRRLGVLRTRSTADSEYSRLRGLRTRSAADSHCGLGALRTRSTADSDYGLGALRARRAIDDCLELTSRHRQAASSRRAAGARRGRRSGIRHAAPPCRRGVGLRVRRDPRDPARRGRCRTVVRRPAGRPAHSAVGGPAAPPVVLAHSLGDGGRLFRRAQGPFARANLRRSEESQ